MKIPYVIDNQTSCMADILNGLLSDPDSPGVSRLEEEIDQLAYALYGFTEEEIGIVEEKT